MEKIMIQITAADLPKIAIGKYLIVWQAGDKKAVARIESVDEKEGIIIFKEHGGKNEGKRYTSHYDQRATNINLYEEEEAIVALLEA
jgi:hypothetical protein